MENKLDLNEKDTKGYYQDILTRIKEKEVEIKKLESQLKPIKDSLKDLYKQRDDLLKGTQQSMFESLNAIKKLMNL